jgi:hypothetical protein
MLQERMVIGDCYILQSPAGEDSSAEYWTATAIFSATRFMLRFFRPGVIDADALDRLGKELLRSYTIKNPFVCDVIELDTFGIGSFLRTNITMK